MYNEHEEIRDEVADEIMIEEYYTEKEREEKELKRFREEQGI